jgi:hypothetical protein
MALSDRDHAHIAVLFERTLDNHRILSFERAISGRLSGASLSKDEIEKQIEENESLRFGSATFWNIFL